VLCWAQAQAFSPRPQSQLRRPSALYARRVVWYTSGDLRVHDHEALVNAAEAGDEVTPLYVFDQGGSRTNGSVVTIRWMDVECMWWYEILALCLRLVMVLYAYGPIQPLRKLSAPAHLETLPPHTIKLTLSSLRDLKKRLEALGSDLVVRTGPAEKEVASVAAAAEVRPPPRPHLWALCIRRLNTFPSALPTALRPRLCGTTQT
jgi:hypothetical protein